MPHTHLAPPSRAPLSVTRCFVGLVAVASAALLLLPAPAQAAGRPTLFGSSIQMEPGETWAGAVQRAEDAYGHLRVLRMFAKEPSDWSVEKWSRSLSDHNGVISFDAPPAEVLAGKWDEQFRAFFASVPRYRRTWWTYDHEPDVAYYQGRLTDLAQYRAAFAHLARLAREADNPLLRTTVVLVGWSANPASGVHVTDFWPGEDLTDVVAWDIYNGWATRQGSYGDMGQIAFARYASENVDKPWAVAEFGSLVLPGDDGTGRAAWITQISRYAYDYGAQFMTYYDSDQYGQGADYRLHDAPSQAAWRAVVTAQSPYDGDD